MSSPQFMVKLELLPMGGSGLADLAHGEGAAQGREWFWELWKLQPRHRTPGSVPQEGDDPFLGKHLSYVTWESQQLLAEQLSNILCYSGLQSKFEWVRVVQSCLTLWDPVDWTLPDSCVHGILQERILEWVAIFFSRVSSRRRDQTRVSWTAGRFFWAPGSSVQFSPTLCDPMDCSILGLPFHHQLPEFTQTHVHWVGNDIQPSHLLSSPSPLTFNLSQHQDLFQWLSSLNQVHKALELQLRHQSFQ